MRPACQPPPIRDKKTESRHSRRGEGFFSKLLDRIQREKDALALKLSDAERNRTNWDLIKAEFGGSWNSFVADLNLLELRLLDAESTKTRRTDR
jgi:hypothetical protein